MVCKLLFAPDGRVLGAQAVGADNVEKQIDVIAAAMKFGGTVRDLAQMELCYAPPYNSAKSPVNMMGFIASNLLDGLAPPSMQRAFRKSAPSSTCAPRRSLRRGT